MSIYSYNEGRCNVNFLDAPYELLVKAFGNDGTVAPRDDYKSEAEWAVATPFGEVQVYDYKVGKCYQGESEGLSREDITDWHVQGDAKAIGYMVALIDLAVAS